MYRSILLFAGLAFAQDLCTTTSTVPLACGCTAEALYTSTKSIDCGGCGTITTTNPIKFHCDIACQPTTSDYTATVTSCAVSSCTSTVTTTEPFGCVITASPTTVTTSVDCGGCALATGTTVNPFDGIGPVCVSGRQTVTGTEGEATVTRCFPTPTGYRLRRA